MVEMDAQKTARYRIISAAITPLCQVSVSVRLAIVLAHNQYLKTRLQTL